MFLMLMVRISFVLSDYSIALPTAAVNSQNTQILGFLPIGFLFKLPIDKLLGLRYNGNNASQDRGGAAEKSSVFYSSFYTKINFTQNNEKKGLIFQSL